MSTGGGHKGYKGSQESPESSTYILGHQNVCEKSNKSLLHSGHQYPSEM